MVLNFNWMQKELPFRPRALNHCSETQVFIHQNSNYTVSTPLPMRKVCLFLYCKNPCFGIWWALGTPSCILLVVGAFSLQKAVETLEEVVSQQEVMRTVSEEETVSMWEVWFHNFKQTAVFWLKRGHSSENSSTEPWTATSFSISLDTLEGDVILLEPDVELLVPGVTEKTAWSESHSAVGRLPSSLPGSGLTALSLGSAPPTSPISPYHAPPMESESLVFSPPSQSLLYFFLHVWESEYPTLNGKLEAWIYNLLLEMNPAENCLFHFLEVNN